MEMKKNKSFLIVLSFLFCSSLIDAQTSNPVTKKEPDESKSKQMPDTLVQARTPQPGTAVGETIPSPIEQGFEKFIINGQVIYRKTVDNVTIEYKPQ
jgi:hypothetical protein